MREAAATALEMTAGYERADLSTNTMLAMALTRCLEISGEAASRMNVDASARFPAIPFPKMVSMRNRLIHAYFDVDLARVCDTIQMDLPPLVAQLEGILALDLER